MNRRTWKLLTVAILALGLLMSSFTAAQAAGEEMIIRFGLSSEPTSLEPVLGMGFTQRTIKMAIYRGLMNYDEDGNLNYALADSYEVSDDNLIYTFHLRDAKFHDGTEVTADDVKYTFERILDPENAASYRAELAVIKSMEVVDEKTISFTLSSPSASFTHYLALPESVILSQAFTESNDITHSPMGAGPFKFVEWASGQYIRLEAFEDYYEEGYPLADGVEFLFYVDGEARTNALMTGDIDIAENIEWKDMAMIESNPDLKLDTIKGPYMVINFNCNEDSPFSNPLVRQAVSYAINRDAIISTAFSGRGEPIYGFVIQEGFLGYNPETENYYSYDPEKAKELLAEAGYPNGFSGKLLSTSSYAMHEQTAVVVQSELAKIGIDLELELPDWATRQSRVAAGDYEIVINGTGGDILDPDWLTNYFYGGDVTLNKSAGYNNDEINALLDKGRASLDPEERQEIYSQISMLIMEDAPAVFLTWRINGYAMRANVQGFKNPVGFLTQSQGGISLVKTYLD